MPMTKHIFHKCFPVFLFLLSLFSNEATAYQLELKNDGWTDEASLGCQGGFASDEEAAVTLGPVASTFSIEKIQFVFCGSTDTVTLTLKIYQESGNLLPGAILHEADYQVTGADDALQEIDLATENILVPGGGSVRVSFMFNHSGYPGVARDDDGNIKNVLNWIKASNFGWVNSETFGLTGDWVIRAMVDVESGGEDAGVIQNDGSIQSDAAGVDGGFHQDASVYPDGGESDGGLEPDASTECITSNECPGGHICRSGACLAVCETSQDCDGGELCDNGVCVPLCTDSSDCSGGEICEDGRCVIFCTSSTDCGGGEMCRENRCVPMKESSSGCGCRAGSGGELNSFALIGLFLLMCFLCVARDQRKS